MTELFADVEEDGGSLEDKGLEGVLLEREEGAGGGGGGGSRTGCLFEEGHLGKMGPLLESGNFLTGAGEGDGSFPNDVKAIARTPLFDDDFAF